MPHLTDLTIRDFKGLCKVDLQGFARANILVGANSCGKTRTLEAIARHCTDHAIPVYKLDVPGDPSLLNLLNDQLLVSIAELLKSAQPKPRVSNPELINGVLYAECEGDRLPVSVMGSGINRLLQLALSIVRSANGVLLIEDLKWAIHVDSCDAFEWLVAWANQHSVQIFATTHDLDAIDAMLDATDEDTDLVLFRLEPREDSTRIVRHPHGRLWRLRKIEQDVR